MNKVSWLNNGNKFWDQTLLSDSLIDYSGDRQIVVVPGRINEVDDVNMEIEQYSKVFVIITSDEENKFPIQDLYHPDMRVWVSYPNREKHWNVDGYLPIGYAKETREKLEFKDKDLDWFFAGQNTHPSRFKCVEMLRDVPNGKLLATEGFAQGIDYTEYMDYMNRAKVIPCPSGNVSPDSFRLYEALEAGCIPIVENRKFWTMMFGEVPFPITEDWSNVSGLIEHFSYRPDVANLCSAWWQLKKRELQCKLQSY